MMNKKNIKVVYEHATCPECDIVDVADLNSTISLADAFRIQKMINEFGTKKSKCVTDIAAELSSFVSSYSANGIHPTFILSGFSWNENAVRRCTDNRRPILTDFETYARNVCIGKFKNGKCRDANMRKIGAILWPHLYAKKSQKAK